MVRLAKSWRAGGGTVHKTSTSDLRKCCLPLLATAVLPLLLWKEERSARRQLYRLEEIIAQNKSGNAKSLAR